MLPYMGDKSIMRPSVQRGFGGINHNLRAADGEIWDMQNMSSREYPLLCPRKARGLVKTLSANKPVALGAQDYLWWVDDTSFYVVAPAVPPAAQDYTGVFKGTLNNNSPKQFACMGTMVLIFPDKKYYDFKSDEFGSLGQSWSGSGVSFINGTYAEVPANANTIKKTGVTWPFQTGDAVTISGCVTHPENNATYIIREVEGDELRFYENTFVLDSILRYTAPEEGLPAGDYYFRVGEDAYSFATATDLAEGDTLTWNGTGLDVVIGGVTSTLLVTPGEAGDPLEFAEIPVDYTESGTIQIVREIPDMDYICVVENRLWGCKEDTIYASALGDPFNFNVFDGLATDSWASDTLEAGEFTGCISFQGYPTFFKEDMIVKVQGDKPSNFEWTASSRFGVKSGCSRSLAIAGDTLFYLSRAGVCAYTGGTPRIISEDLGANTKWDTGVAGSDGIRYYITMTDGYAYALFVYDTRYGVWHKEDATRAVGFAFWREGLYMLRAGGDLFRIDGEEGTAEGSISWIVEFADIYRYYETKDTKSQDKKGVLRLQIRCELPSGSTLKVYVKYDSSGDWQKVADESGTNGVKRSYIVPLILKRCDHYRLKITGSDACVIYSLTETQYAGSPFPASSVPIAPVIK